jgi:hypothetical protein
MGYVDKRAQLLGYAEKAKFPDPDNLVFAIPDPHIERWYLDDPQGFNKAIGTGALPVLPHYKCEKGLYKKVMRDAIASSGVAAQFGGYEYGEKIVEEMDLCLVGQTSAHCQSCGGLGERAPCLLKGMAERPEEQIPKGK